jgi:hypothetical protein
MGPVYLSMNDGKTQLRTKIVHTRNYTWNLQTVLHYSCEQLVVLSNIGGQPTHHGKSLLLCVCVRVCSLFFQCFFFPCNTSISELR